MIEAAQEARKVIARSQTMVLVVPECEKGIGTVISGPDSEHLIEGVQIQPQALFPDDRGYFLELHRMGKGLAADFPAGSTQVSAALNYRGTIKAFHYHLDQTDLWVPVAGMFQVALVDLREGCRTFGQRNTIYVGALRPWQLRIPPGVAHGYKVIGEEASVLVYLTDRFYNPADEGRIPFNEPGINYDWETQHK
jgi:dTDP-4-dehydrorhamnose 3,5-epimerase